MLTSLRNPLELINKFKTDAEQYLLSPGEVDKRLASIAESFGFPLLGARISTLNIAQEWGNGTEEISTTDNIGDNGRVKIELCCTQNTRDLSKAEQQRIQLELLEAMKAVWGHAMRNEHGGLSLKHNDVSLIFPKSIRRLSEQRQVENAATIYIDLDNFKAVNDNGTHEDGDTALRFVYACMHETARELHGLAFFDGGDEFILVIPSEDRMAVLTALHNLRTAIKRKTFGPKNLSVDITAGVAWCSIDEIVTHFQTVKTVCEKLTKNINEQKKRGTVTFDSWQGTPKTPSVTVPLKAFLQLGICLAHSRYFMPRVFGDERLDFIVENVKFLETHLTDKIHFSKFIGDCLNWLDLKLITECIETTIVGSNGVGAHLPTGAVALAIMLGLARRETANPSSKELNIPCIKVMWDSTKNRLGVYAESQLIWGNECERDDEGLLFGPITKEITEHRTLGAVIGVQIGFQEIACTEGGLPVPTEFFSTHVRVDVRPRIGGGLPDFWQVAVAQVVATLGRDKSIGKVLIWGNNPEQTETFKRLKGQKLWPMDEVAALAGLSIGTVKTVAEELPKIIVFAKSPSDLIQIIYKAYLDRKENSSAININNLPKSSLLSRPMATAGVIGQEEAIVCNTAALAYPIIIDTLRKSSTVRRPRDDADQELCELLGFKLKLVTPLIDTAPPYLMDQFPDLEEYANCVLLKNDGLIRRKLEGTNQVSAFINHLSHYLKNTKAARSTRRACLVVPHDLESGTEPHPLGLICVWATPRFEKDGRRILDFVFVWRTVEAFIGLPYSLFGSIKLAEQLASIISRELRTDGPNRQVEVGELTYIALSLHLGSDDFHMRIAKRIVDSASD